MEDYGNIAAIMESQLLLQEDVAEAFAYSLLGKSGRTENAQKKIDLISDFMKNYR